jgi:hypothetical protein
MVYPQLEQQLAQARHDLRQATSETIIHLCKHYLALLSVYRSKLYELQGTSAINQQSASPTSPEDVSDSRRAIRAAIETTTKERNGTEMLLLSMTTVSGYEAVEIFNRREYEGHKDWELRSSGVKFSGGTGRDLLTIQEAVDIAGLLRREELVAAQAFKENTNPVTLDIDSIDRTNH